MQASLFALYLAYSVCTTSVNEWTSLALRPLDDAQDITLFFINAAWER